MATTTYCARSLDEARKVAAATFATTEFAVAVHVDSWIGELVVYRDDTVKLAADVA